MRSSGPVGREAVLLRFALDDEAQVKAVLRDLCDSELLRLSDGPQTIYRAASEDELLAGYGTQSQEGLDELLIAVIYREGPLGANEIAARLQTEPTVLLPSLERLVDFGRLRLERDRDGCPATRLNPC